MNSFARVFLSILILSLISTGIYFGGSRIFGLIDEIKKSSLKKQISIKPDNIKEKQATLEPWSIEQDKFTFFDTLNDSSMSKFIGLNENGIQPKGVVANTPDFDLKIKDKSPPQSIGVNVEKNLNSDVLIVESLKHGELFKSGFALQVGSFKALERANLLKNYLDKKGYPVFIVKVRILQKNETWHRVFIGRFLQRQDAVTAKIKVKDLENLNSVLIWQEGLNPQAS